MESMVKPGLNGTQEARSQVKDDGAGMPRLMRIGDMVLRLVALATTLVAAIVIGTAKQTKMVNIQVTPTLPPLPVTAVAKTAYSSAFV
ncbi:putative CASP-like protein 1E2 [Cocos nucifera]|uniref:CASP-like protein n=1 Tax=Cocos nucifera TaxID=13894 RepID=A0A8K0ISJ6_COCNU|nr:putative CASP-like protein 1E2 [Cocos nucifera]